MMSESECALSSVYPRMPSSVACRLSSRVLTRLPLCPRTTEPPSVVGRNIGWALSQLAAPVVEYRQWPIATWPCIDSSVFSSKTWLTRPRSL